jgi:two-component system, cell cycle sensor histidine kinase and response regulator CckA
MLPPIPYTPGDSIGQRFRLMTGGAVEITGAIGKAGDRGAVRSELAGSRQGHPRIAAVMALALAAGVWGVATLAPHRMGLPALLGLGAAALVGLIFSLGVVAGFVHIGRLPRQRVFFDGLLDAVADPCVVTDLRGRVVYANEPYRQLLSAVGLNRLVGVENLYAGYPEVADRVYRLSQAAREGRAAHEEFRLSPGSAAALARPDKPAWIRAQIRPVGLPTGQVYTLWRLIDLTDDRARQEEAFGHLQYIINYLDHAPAGFFSTAPSGEIVYVNATLAGWLDIDLDRTTDGTLTLDQLVTPEGARRIARIEPVPGGVRVASFDLDLQGRDGKAIPVHIVHRMDFSSDGQPLPSRSLVLDRRGREAEPVSGGDIKIARLINNAPIGIVQIDRDGRILSMNAAFTHMAEVARLGSPLALSIAEGHRAAFADALAAALAGEVPEPLDFAFAGEPQHTGQLLFGRYDQAGAAALTLYATDTTRHSSLEVQLAQSRKMLAIGQLAGGVAHDFNNVLTAIIGFSDLLLARHKPTDPSFADIMNIKQNANRAANLVRQLLAFSRRQTLRPEITSLSDIISDLGHLLGRLLGEKVELKIVHGRDIGLVRVDINQFEQVIINLAVNARDAMPSGGVLTIRTLNLGTEEARTVRPGLLPPADYVVCEVEDSGIGMPPDVLEKIFEPFFTTKEVGKGTGLGLSTVYGIVKQTGGFIFCDSEVGRGTVFRIYLQRHSGAAREIAAVQQAETRKDAKSADLTGRGTILLVEDEDAVRSFASRALQSRGYTVLTAETGERALEVVETHGQAIDLVLSDVVMPEMDGPTLLRELRRRGIGTKVVFISGYAEDAFEKNLEGQTDFAFLPKPFTLKQLAEAVKDAMSS